MAEFIFNAIQRLWRAMAGALDTKQKVGQAVLFTATAFFCARLIEGFRNRRLELDGKPEPGPREKELQTSDPGLLAKYSAYNSIKTRVARYPVVRVFYKPHSHADKLPSDPPLPLLVFIHGLGGSLAQFQLLLTSLVNVGPCFGIDLPGCGLSRFAPTRWDAYTFDALVDIWDRAIEEHCDYVNGQKVILIGHSMGCMIAQRLAARQSTWNVSGIIAICPPVQSFEPSQKLVIGTLLSIPTPIFDLWRAWDKRGGIDSASVTRFVGKDADRQTRELQLRFNDQSRTPVFRRFAWGAVMGTTPSADDWANLPGWTSVLLIGAKDDLVTPVKLLHKIREAIEKRTDTHTLKVSIGPGSHALPFDHCNYRSVAGIIQDFLGSCDERLSLGWQLNHLATEGKWEVKNLAKWQATEAVSGPIGKPAPIFRAMKTMRESDDVHSPKQLLATWKDKVYAVVDISHDTPVYNPESLEAGGIKYHKLPTVSKYAPDESEVKSLIKVVDSFRDEMNFAKVEKQIAVHCHYGKNRTGFLIAAYLIERDGYEVQAAINEFAEMRPPGIRHEHFLNTLFTRYNSKAKSGS